MNSKDLNFKQPNTVICEEPTGRANARPMTGEATKQSTLLFLLLHGLLRFARNDGKIQVRDLAAPFARGLPLTSRP
jgi:hypothetical protein